MQSKADQKGGVKGEGVDGHASPGRPRRDLHQSYTTAEPRNPSFYYSASPALVFLSPSNQHLELGRVSTVASGIKAALWHTTAEQSQDCKM